MKPTVQSLIFIGVYLCVSKVVRVPFRVFFESFYFEKPYSTVISAFVNA